MLKFRAAALAQGLAMQHGFPSQTPAEPPVDGSCHDWTKLVTATVSPVFPAMRGEMGVTQLLEAPTSISLRVENGF